MRSAAAAAAASFIIRIRVLSGQVVVIFADAIVIVLIDILSTNRNFSLRCMRFCAEHVDELLLGDAHWTATTAFPRCDELIFDGSHTLRLNEFDSADWCVDWLRQRPSAAARTEEICFFFTYGARA